MRSRYYNPVIKRFINRDTVAGEMTNSKSLNRFAYVQGNPVSYTDPFGLSPSGNSHSFKNLIHSVLDVLGMIPGIGEIFDLANAAMYLVEGNYKMAGLSLLGALPLIGNMVGGIKFAEGCVKLTKAANAISKTIKYASIIGGIAVAGYTAFTAGKDIYQGVKNHDLTLGRVIADVLSIGISAAGIGFGLKELGSNIKDDFGIDLKENFKEFLADNRGFVDLDATIGGSKGGSDTYSRKGAFRAAKRDAGIPVSQQPYDIQYTPMRTAEYEGASVIKDNNGNIIMTKEYYFKNNSGETIVIQDHSAGHTKGGRGSHFNVRPDYNTRTGYVSGTQDHYPFEK